MYICRAYTINIISVKLVEPSEKITPPIPIRESSSLSSGRDFEIFSGGCGSPFPLDTRLCYISNIPWTPQSQIGTWQGWAIINIAITRTKRRAILFPSPVLRLFSWPLGLFAKRLVGRMLALHHYQKFGFSWSAWFSNSFLLGAKCEAMTLGAMLCALEKRCSTIQSPLV